MQVVKKILKFSSRDEATWRLVPFGDNHLGHANFDQDLHQATIDYIADTPRTVWIGMGDYCDAITAKDRRYDPHAIDERWPTPDRQYRAITEMLEPIAHKGIGLLDGNHDLQHCIEHQHNYMDNLAYALGVPYLTINAYVRLVFQRRSGKRPKNNQFNLYAHHGWTSSRTSGGRVNRIQDLAKTFPGLPLYLMGHVHVRGEAPPNVNLSVDQRLRVIHREERFVFTGGYLKGYLPGAASYVEEKGYVPTSLGSPVIEVTVNDQARPPQSPFTITVGEVPR